MKRLTDEQIKAIPMPELDLTISNTGWCLPYCYAILDAQLEQDMKDCASCREKMLNERLDIENKLQTEITLLKLREGKIAQEIRQELEKLDCFDMNLDFDIKQWQAFWQKYKEAQQ